MIHILGKAIIIVKDNAGSQKYLAYASKLIAHCLHISREISNFALLFGFLKIIGDISQQIGKVKRAGDAYGMMRDIGYEVQNLKLKV